MDAIQAFAVGLGLTIGGAVAFNNFDVSRTDLNPQQATWSESPPSAACVGGWVPDYNRQNFACLDMIFTDPTDVSPFACPPTELRYEWQYVASSNYWRCHFFQADT